jgi:hypothetical protein
MTALELANQSLMTEQDAQLVLDKIQGMAFWNAEMIIELSLCGFSASQIAYYLDNDPEMLLVYLAIHT